MERRESQSIGLIEAPIGCDYLLLATIYGLGVADLALPNISMHVAAGAISNLSAWRPNLEQVVQDVLAEGARLLPLARELLTHEATHWWFDSFDPDAQIWVAPLKNNEVPMPTIAPAIASTKGDRYQQRPETALITSTQFDQTTSMLAGASEGAGDLDGILAGPLVRYRLRVSPSARIYSIDAPADWRQLCERYPSADKGGLHGGLLTPNFEAIAREWDGVHLTFGGLLSALQVPLDGPQGRTQLLGWEAEQTVWLRWVFDDVIRLADTASPIRSPLTGAKA